MNSQEKNKRDYEYQKKYLKRITVWYNTKSKNDMELINWLDEYAGDDLSRSEAVKTCIWKCMKADQEKIHGMRKEAK